MGTAALTEKQARILDFIRRHYREAGLPPSLREVCDEFGFMSTNAAWCHIKPLLRRGYVRRICRGANHRYLPVVPEGCCPCCGRPGD